MTYVCFGKCFTPKLGLTDDVSTDMNTEKGAGTTELQVVGPTDPFTDRVLKMECGSHYIPKKSKSKPQGDDSHFIKIQTLGIADGVGGWTSIGIDGGKYARELMSRASAAVCCRTTNPKLILKEAYSKTKAKGSCTACILTLNGDSLHAVNLGDSGFVVIRSGKIVYESPKQMHKFNVPYQLGHSSKDGPGSAVEIRVSVEAGDVVVVGTDGLFDNVFGTDIEVAVSDGVEEGCDPKDLACKIGNLALERSVDKYGFTPFEWAAREAGYPYKGGKYDDITVLVAYIVKC